MTTIFWLGQNLSNNDFFESALLARNSETQLLQSLLFMVCLYFIYFVTKSKYVFNLSWQYRIADKFFRCIHGCSTAKWQNTVYRFCQ